MHVVTPSKIPTSFSDHSPDASRAKGFRFYIFSDTRVHFVLIYVYRDTSIKTAETKIRILNALFHGNSDLNSLGFPPLASTREKLECVTLAVD